MLLETRSAALFRISELVSQEISMSKLHMCNSSKIKNHKELRTVIFT